VEEDDVDAEREERVGGRGGTVAWSKSRFRVGPLILGSSPRELSANSPNSSNGHDQGSEVPGPVKRAN
jgi:hypothetical protein